MSLIFVHQSYTMFDGVVIYYFPFFSSEDLSSDANIEDIKGIKSWQFVDSSFNDYFINIFTQTSRMFRLGEEIVSSKIFDYDDELSNCIFTTDTGLGFRDYRYLNVMKCGFRFKNLSADEVQAQVKSHSQQLYNAVLSFEIPEFASKAEVIKQQLFHQKLKIQMVLIDHANLSFEQRKYCLLDLALDKKSGTANATYSQSVKQFKAHSFSYLEALMSESLVDQYQEWSGFITPKKFIAIYECDAAEAEGNYRNNSVQFGLIYIQKIILSEFINLLNLWINENKFENNLSLSKYYLRFARNFDFQTVSTKYLYNNYSERLDKILNIATERQWVLDKIKEIEGVLEKEKNQITNLLLFLIALLQLAAVFLDDIRHFLVGVFSVSEEAAKNSMSAMVMLICLFIGVVFFLKRRI